MGNQGFRRTRTLCRAQQSSITRSRTPAFHRRIRSFTIRQRLTLLLICSIRSRRWWSAWLASSCSRDNSPPRGFVVGMRISTWGRVNARQPRSCNPGSRGLTVPAAFLGYRRCIPRGVETQRMTHQPVVRLETIDVRHLLLIYPPLDQGYLCKQGQHHRRCWDCS